MATGTGSTKLPGIPGPEPERKVSRRWLWVELVVSIVLALALALLSIGFITDAAGAHGHSGPSRTGQVIGAIVTLALVYLCTRWTVRVEHRLRADSPVGQALATATPPASGPRIRRARRRHNSPRALAIGGVVFALVAIGAAAGTVLCYEQAARSSYTQDHGVRVTATVDSVDNTQSCSRYGCDWSAAIVVTLSSPVDGVRTTTVHYPDQSDLIDGQTVVVLVDPKQPGYAELPGSPFAKPVEWIILALLALGSLGLALLEFRALRRLRAQRQQLTAGTTASTGGAVAPSPGSS